MQQASEDILKLKYLTPNEQTREDMFRRVANQLASVEQYTDEWQQRFFSAMNTYGAIPAGRILSNLGAAHIKPNTSTINCTVSKTIGDSLDDIMNSAHEGALTLAAGCGIGYEFSTLRPRGAYVHGAGAYTSGATSFIDIFDAMCFTVASAGGRRGAQMASFDIHHPDVEAFITAKSKAGRWRQFNCSVLVDDAFMEAVVADKTWCLSFPVRNNDPNRSTYASDDLLWRRFPLSPDENSYTRDDNNQVLCLIYKRLPARELWNKIMRTTYDYAEPGILFIDNANTENPLGWCEEFRTTNPCAEQWLPPYGACLLGSIDLTRHVVSPFDNPSFNKQSFIDTVEIFSRMLDNVVEFNNLPLMQQQDEIHRKRRHGMGILGLGSALTMLNIRYGSDEAIEFTTMVSKLLALASLKANIDLAEEKGPAPIFRDIINREQFINSRYIQRLLKEIPDYEDQILKHGLRFSHATSIAPTGTISLAVCDNVSNGIEPTYAHHYKRNIIKSGKTTKEQQDVYSYESRVWYHRICPNTPLPEHAVTADQITPLQHLAMQAAAQPWIDSSISKTINVPTDIPFNEFKNIYMDAWQAGLKGCTTYRFNPEGVGSVLIRNEDLQRKSYTFSLSDGTKITARGDEQVLYEGEVHNAYNLYEAIKEGQYGRF